VLLIHWQYIRISPLDRTMATDERARRAVSRREYDTAFQIKGQVDFNRRLNRIPGYAGANEETATVVTIRKSDALRASYTPQDGDRVDSVIDRDGTEDPLNLYVRSAHPSGAWAAGRHTEWVLVLRDDSPNRRAEN
jgi:hypothetical protein